MLPHATLRPLVQYRLLPALRNNPGISRVDVMGGKRAAYMVEPDINQMLRLNLSIADLQTTLKANNINANGRYLQEHNLDLPIRGVGQVKTLDDLRYLLVKTQANGQPIFLEDIAQVKPGALPEHNVIRRNQKPAVAITMQKENGYSTLQVAMAVDQKIRELTAILPVCSDMHKCYYQS